MSPSPRRERLSISKTASRRCWRPSVAPATGLTRRRAASASTTATRPSPAVIRVPRESWPASLTKASCSSALRPTTKNSGCRPTASRFPPPISNSSATGSPPVPSGPTTCSRSPACFRSQGRSRSRDKTTGRFSRSRGRRCPPPLRAPRRSTPSLSTHSPPPSSR